MAGSSHTLTVHRSAKPNPLGEIQTGWVGDDATGAVPNLNVTFPYDCELLSVFTKTILSATNLWDLTLVDANSFDRLQGVAMNRDTVAAQEVPVVFSGTALHPTVRSGETMALTIGGNSDTTSSGTIIIRYRALANV